MSARPCPRCAILGRLCVLHAARAKRKAENLARLFPPPDDGRDHFNAGLDDWDRDADSRQADREVGDE